MKKFLKIFIFLEVILFAYIFNTSIYNMITPEILRKLVEGLR